MVVERWTGLLGINFSSGVVIIQQGGVNLEGFYLHDTAYSGKKGPRLISSLTIVRHDTFYHHGRGHSKIFRRSLRLAIVGLLLPLLLRTLLLERRSSPRHSAQGSLLDSDHEALVSWIRDCLSRECEVWYENRHTCNHKEGTAIQDALLEWVLVKRSQSSRYALLRRISLHC